MKISIKTIKGEIFQVEIDQESTVLVLKGKIQEKLSIEPESQKLIYKGKHLENNSTLKDYGLQDGDTIIVMMLKKFTAQDPTTVGTKVETPAPAPTPVLTPVAPAPAPVQAPAPAPAPAPMFNPNVPAPQPHVQLDPNNEIVFGNAHKAETLKELTDMGFDRTESERALVAAFFNKDRAVDYLLNGIPANLLNPPAQPANPGANHGAPAQGAEGHNEQAGPAPVAVTHEQMEQIQQLITSPEFENIRQQFLQNPAIAQQLLTFLQQQRPELHALFVQHPQLLVAILTNQFNMPGDDGDDGEYLPDNAEDLAELTQQDKEAIAEMQTLGFSQAQCTEAYLVCDKNKELAINYLLGDMGNVPGNPNQ